MDLVLRRLMRTWIHRGISGGSQVWLVLGVSALGVRALRKLARPAPEVIYRAELHAGDRFEIGSRRS